MPRLASFGSPLETVGTWKEPCRKRHHTTSQWLRQQRRTGLCLLSCRRSKPASRLFFMWFLWFGFAKILNEDPQVVTLLPDVIKCTRFLPEWVEEKIQGQPIFWVVSYEQNHKSTAFRFFRGCQVGSTGGSPTLPFWLCLPWRWGGRKSGILAWWCSSRE